jgi:hypothetical protein
MSAVPKCRRVTVHLFRGNDEALRERVRRALDEQMHGLGLGPSPLECLLAAGHTGVSTDSEPNVIWGFNPNIGNHPLWQAMRRLRARQAYPGIVTDDTNVFAEAQRIGLKVLTFDVIFPEPGFLRFEQDLIAERPNSRFTYGFPNGDGECNCATWLERLALPLLSGSMEEFTTMTSSSRYPRRRFGQCI